jgi:hypothetical protein
MYQEQSFQYNYESGWDKVGQFQQQQPWYDNYSGEYYHNHQYHYQHQPYYNQYHPQSQFYPYYNSYYNDNLQHDNGGVASHTWMQSQPKPIPESIFTVSSVSHLYTRHLTGDQAV